MTFDGRVELLAPSGADLMRGQNSRALQPFAPQVLAFLGNLSQMLCQDPRVRTLPDLYSFGFWCRRASLTAMQRQYPEIEYRLGRGLVFHVGPSNVPVNFAYSLVAGLLAGNANIVRVPSADFIQIRIIAQAVDTLLSQIEYQDLKDHIRLVRYDRHANDITAHFSGSSDVRVIWGGDDTVENIRHHPLPARAFDVTFADRYSVCVVGAERYLAEGKAEVIAQSFYNDAYLFDQNACTSPHLVLWLGNETNVQQARDLFWSHLHTLAQSRYTLEPRSGVDKLAQALHFAARHPGTRIVPCQDNFITRIELENLDPGIEDWHGNSGLFYEYVLTDLNELLPIINRRYQTLSYTGLDKSELQALLVKGRAPGIDRIVPIGRTLEFSLQWDGYDLIRTLSRLVTVI
jgi:Acyl-CoA reductase (LuxC)